jgi:hypothetical protein
LPDNDPEEDEQNLMNWKLIAIGLASFIGLGAAVGTTVVVMKHAQSTAAQIPVTPPQTPEQTQAPAPPVEDSSAQRLQEVKAECREIAQSRVKERTGEVLKDSALGALLGAGTGSAGGAIAHGGSGAGQGAAIGSVVGAVGGVIYGMNENSKEAIFRKAYDDCMRSHS